MKRIILAVITTLFCMLLLPFILMQSAQGWDALGYVILLFFILYPTLAIFLGIMTGLDLKKLWWLPIVCALASPPLLWIALSGVTLELYLYVPIYIALAFVSAAPTALIKHAISLKRK